MDVGASLVVLVAKYSPANAGDIRDVGLIPGSGRSPGGGHDNPFQYSCLENPMDRGVRWATVHRVTEDPSLIQRSERSAGEGIGYPLQYSWASLMTQLIKNPPAMWETWVQSLDWENPLEKGKATHSSILAWRSPWGRKESDTTEHSTSTAHSQKTTGGRN